MAKTEELGPTAPQTTVTTTGLSVLETRPHPSPQRHCPRLPTDIWPADLASGAPLLSQGTQFIIRREMPFAKKRKGSGALEAKGRAKWQEASLTQVDAVPRCASQSARLSSKACRKPWTRSSRLAESLCKRVRRSWGSPLAGSPSCSSCSVTAAWSLSSCCLFRSSAYTSRAFC